jgi:hypothetical protein
VIDDCFAKLRPLVGTAGACRGSGKSRATHYRRCQPPKLGPARPRSTPFNALSQAETAELLALLRSPRFVDLAPAQVWAIVLDEGRYVASISTMYRVLRANDEIRERRAQAKHPTRARPELMADKPNSRGLTPTIPRLDMRAATVLRLTLSPDSCKSVVIRGAP